MSETPIYMINPNSSLRWLGPIEAELPVPATVTVRYNHSETLSAFDGEQSAELDRLVVAVTAAAEKIGYPVFIRSDLGSAKHGGPLAYRADGPDDIMRALCRTIEDNEMKFWTERFGPSAIMVRQFLCLESPFTAFGGLPISREWRFFANGQSVLCAHPYWPEESIAFWGKGEPEHWREALHGLQQVPAEMAELEGMAIRAAALCGGGAWSVDIAKDTDGKWWVTDMATAQDSYHWPGCENGKAQENLPR